MKIGIVIGIVIVVAALVVCLVPLKWVSYEVTVDYEDTETYYENEPYEDIETYTETIPLDYEVADSFDKEKNGHPCTYVEVKNTDDTSGLFIVTFSFKVSYIFIGGGSIELVTYVLEDEEKSLSLNPNESKTATYCEGDIDIGDDWSWSYEVTAGTKEVERERTVIKYRQVEKERTVTKQRLEIYYKKVTLLNYLLHY